MPLRKVTSPIKSGWSGATVLGAFFLTVPYQYIWVVLALLVALAVMGVVSINDLQF